MIDYVPPYEITNEMINLVSQIMEKIGNLASVKDLKKLPRLRKGNRIKSIHSSLAIENNTLSYQEVTAVLDGKKVIAPPNDIVNTAGEEGKDDVDCYAGGAFAVFFTDGVDVLYDLVVIPDLVNAKGDQRVENEGPDASVVADSFFHK